MLDSHDGDGRPASRFANCGDGRGWGTGECDDFMYMAGEGYAIGFRDPTLTPHIHARGHAPDGAMRKA